MALESNFVPFGLQYASFYRRSDKMPKGLAEIVASSQFSLSAEFSDLSGGSNKFFWASELKAITSEVSLTLKTYKKFFFEDFLGGSKTDIAASSNGTVATIANAKGESAVAATGIASVALKSGEEADLKTGTYVVQVTGPDKVNVYLLSNLELARGADLNFVDDSLKITPSELTIAQSTATAIPNTGLEITGGTGVIAMDTGDSATFDVVSPHGGYSEIVIGKVGTDLKAFGLKLAAQKRSNGDMFLIDIPNCVAGGMPISLEEGEFATTEITCRALYDSEQNRVASFQRIRGQDS